jgi:hypothetical protein
MYALQRPSARARSRALAVDADMSVGAHTANSTKPMPSRKRDSSRP